MYYNFRLIGTKREELLTTVIEVHDEALLVLDEVNHKVEVAVPVVVIVVEPLVIVIMVPNKVTINLLRATAIHAVAWVVATMAVEEISIPDVVEAVQEAEEAAEVIL